MHERPEYNVPTADMVPDLTLFDEDIWPDDFPVYDVQRDLQQLFVTDFKRHRWLLKSGAGVIEMVLDLGQVLAQGPLSALPKLNWSYKVATSMMFIAWASSWWNS